MCLSGFLRILFSLWLAGLSILKLWALRLRSVLAYCASILRLRLLGCLLFSTFLLIFLLGSGNNPVYAQEETPTPYPTETPSSIYLATPTPIQNYDCPGVQPVGYGTVTPSAYWNLKCGQCITPMPLYDWGTPDPEIFGTTEPTPTTVTSLGEFDPDVLVNLYWASDEIPDFEYLTWDTEMTRTETFGRNYISNSQTNGSYITNYHIKLDGTFHGGSSIYSAYTVEFGVTIHAYTPMIIRVYEGVDEFGSGGTLYDEIELVATDDWYIGTGESGANNTTFAFNGNWVIEVEVLSINSISNDYQLMMWGYQWLTGTIDYTLALEYHYGSYTGGSEPIPDGYCSYIQSDLPGGAGGDDNFKLPQITIGVGSCLTIPGLNIPLGWTDTLFNSGWEEIYLPETTVCIKPIEFGTLNLFGVSIDIDLLAIGLAGIVLLRIITRS